MIRYSFNLICHSYIKSSTSGFVSPEFGSNIRPVKSIKIIVLFITYFITYFLKLYFSPKKQLGT